MFENAPKVNKKSKNKIMDEPVLEQRRIRNEESLWNVFIYHNYDGQAADGEPVAQANPVTEPGKSGKS
ncbi:hypothetical protein L3Y34_002179 [Caenorhabditis briggsae]|uniref:Uncharacterized protein n=1 Tax=Caenorhabditis briggsae TaxID=6238 RepID=A0AAE9DES8_CAEBR|nr:hypothetical protein L3Y34_002179 [Caenorhabditis briggsae]